MTWGAVIGAGVGLVGSMMSSGGGGSGGSASSGAYDPYGPYRGQAAQQLQTLQAHPGDASNTSYGQAMSQAASRGMASQGYTGSGNAVVAAANAGGMAYQQEFNNLALLAGAGQNPAAAAQVQNQQANYNQQQNNQMWQQLGGLTTNLWNSSSAGPGVIGAGI